jgi:hypothetical protein
MNTDFGHPEVLVGSGTYLLVNNYFGIGLTLLILGVLGGLFRATLRFQKSQQELEAKQKLLSEVNDAGEEIGTAIATLLGAFSSDKKKKGGTVH